MAFTYLEVKSEKCLCLPSVLLFWSWSCKQRSWSCYFGHGLGLKNLVLFTSLLITFSTFFDMSFQENVKTRFFYFENRKIRILEG